MYDGLGLNVGTLENGLLNLNKWKLEITMLLGLHKSIRIQDNPIVPV